MEITEVHSPMIKFLVVLLIFYGTVVVVSEAELLRLENREWRESSEARGSLPENLAPRNNIHSSARGIKPIIRWKNHWKFQRCPPGMKRDNVGMCRAVWG
jgi:hypothetical protein